MILYLKTADELCQIWLDEQKFTWPAGRELSKGLLRFLQQSLENQRQTWSDVTAIVVFRGPGSYTSLRIGLTVANTLADSLQIPIVGAEGDDWRQTALNRITQNPTASDGIVTPIYTQDVFITKPRK